MSNRSLDKLALVAGQNVKERDFWLDRLAGDPVMTGFPCDFNDRYETELSVGEAKFVVKGELFSRLMGIVKGSDVKLHMMLLAGLTVLLEKYTGNRDVMIATPIYRQAEEIDFINTVLMIRNQVETDMTFKDLLFLARENIIEATENQNYPLEILFDQLKLSRDGGDRPGFDVVMLVENIHDKKYLQTIHYNLLFSIRRTADTLEGIIEYNAALYEPETVTRLAEHFRRVLETAAADGDTRLEDIDILHPEERARLLDEFNSHSGGWKSPEYPPLSLRFELQVEKNPDHVAVAGPGAALSSAPPSAAAIQLSYKEMNDRAGRVAGTLRNRGVVPGGLVGLMTVPSVEMLVGLMGILKAGGAYLPIDIDYPGGRIHYILRDSGLKILVTGGEVPPLGDTAVERVDIGEACTGGSFPPIPAVENRPSAVAYVIYTSGTTGLPKGVLVEHGNVLAYIEAFNDEFHPSGKDIFLQQASVCFDAFVEEVYPVLFQGGKVAVCPREVILDSDGLTGFLNRQQVTMVSCSPLLLNAMNSFTGLGSIHTYINGGDRLKMEYVSSLLKRGSVYNTYGPTETTVCATYYRCTASGMASPPIGRPISRYRVFILNNGARLAPPGVPGELCIGGAGVSRGYLNRVELTAAKFIFLDDPDEGPVYRTGDLARWLPDGNIGFLGRIDDQVQIRGYRVEPGEIESRLLRQGEIRQAVVVAREERREEQLILCAYFVAGRSLTVGELRDYLSRDLPDYMVPARFVQLDRLPLTPGGKVDRRALPEPVKIRDRQYAAPRDETEQRLVAIWAEVLDSGAEHIGIDDDFFESGGYSWKATLLISRIHQVLGVRLPLTEVFKTPTIRALSAYIKGADKKEYAAVQPVEKRDYYPLSSAQRRLYILQQMEPGSLAYNMPQFLPMSGEIEPDRLAAAFQMLVARHESLRTAFMIVEDEPVQRIQAAVDFDIETCDLPGEAPLPGSSAPGSAGREVLKAFIRPFDLASAPLLRVALIRAPGSLPRIFLDMHHIVTDGVSQAILAEELARLYFGARLAPVKLQYRDYSRWLCRREQQELLREQEAYWMGEFSDELPVLNLPVDHPRPLIQSFAGSRVRFMLAGADVPVLKELAAGAEATLFMSVLSAYMILLSKLSGQEDIIVGTPVAGRRHTDLERIVGMFVNTLPLRDYPAGDKTFTDFLDEVKRRTLQAYENQEYQFEDLVERVSVRRDTGRNPVFDVMFTLLNRDEYGDRIPDIDEHSPFEHRQGISKFDMSLTAVDLGARLFFILEYCTKLFDAETVERFIGYFKQLIRQIARQPQAHISRLEIISPREKRLILEEFNAGGADYPRDRTVHQAFEIQARRNPGTIAARFEDLQLSYGELNGRTDRLAVKLRERGIAADGIAALMVDRSLEMIIGMMGAIKAGGAYLPIDPNYPAARKEYMLENSRAAVLLTQAYYRDEKGQSRPGPTGPEVLCLDDADLYCGVAADPGLTGRAADLCYVIYTSGTTGNPKGVMIEHSALMNFIYSMYNDFRRDFGPFDNCLNVTNFSFDVSVCEIFLPLVFGAAVVILPYDRIFDPAALAAAIIDRSVTFTYLPPGLLQAVYENLAPSKSMIVLNKMLVGVEPIKDYVLENYLQLNADFRLVNGYGPTEATICATTYIYRSREPEGRTVPIGKPLANTGIYLLDRYLQPVPLGVAGELCISGEGLARGYLWNRELTEQKFILNPFKAGGRLYRTGDLARWTVEGNIEFLGRVDHQVKIRGFRIEPGEIEAQLLNHERIEKAVVLDRLKESGEKYLCGYIVFEESAANPPGSSELKEYLSRLLPDYMVPAYFVTLPEIPLTVNGKIDRRALPEPALVTADSYVAPRDEYEGKVVQIWAEVLGIDGDTIGIDANFFDLGGHSLSLIKMSSQVRNVFNKNIPVATLFRLTTIRSLARYLQEESIDRQVSDEVLDESVETMDETLSLLMEDESE